MTVVNFPPKNPCLLLCPFFPNLLYQVGREEAELCFELLPDRCQLLDGIKRLLNLSLGRLVDDIFGDGFPHQVGHAASFALCEREERPVLFRFKQDLRAIFGHI